MEVQLQISQKVETLVSFENMEPHAKIMHFALRFVADGRGYIKQHSRVYGSGQPYGHDQEHGTRVGSDEARCIPHC